MALSDVLDITISLCKEAYLIVMEIRDKEIASGEFKYVVNATSHDLAIATSLLIEIQKVVHRVSLQDENLLIERINALQDITKQTKELLAKVNRDRNLFQRLVMRRDEYRQHLTILQK